MTGDVWSWADVPGLDTELKRRKPRRQTPRGHGHKHPVTLGHHDDVIIPMARRGERIIHIASEVDCNEGLIVRRLRALGVEYWR